jgi:hypothetical protein
VLYDRDRFNCSSCAAKPDLQSLQGCFKPSSRPLGELAGETIDRCPVTYQSARVLRVLRMFEDGALNAVYETKMKWTTKRLAALRHVEYLFKLKEAHSNGH